MSFSKTNNKMNRSCNNLWRSMGNCPCILYLSVYYSLDIGLDAYFINQFIAPSRFTLFVGHRPNPLGGTSVPSWDRDDHKMKLNFHTSPTRPIHCTLTDRTKTFLDTNDQTWTSFHLFSCTIWASRVNPCGGSPCKTKSKFHGSLVPAQAQSQAHASSS